jgi:membrane-associated phospholipid phosphatase
LNKKLTYIPGKYFNYPFFVFGLLSVLLIVLFARGEVELWVNSWSNPALDVFFLILTTLGSGWFAVAVLFIFLFVDYRKTLYILLTLFFVALLSSVFKRVIFFQHYRPLWDFFYADLQRVIPGMPIRYMYSFPSGHTMTAFAMATVISFLYKKKWVAFGLLTLAVLVGFSRIYLLQHYLIDVVGGAILGYLSSWLGIASYNKFFK